MRRTPLTLTLTLVLGITAFVLESQIANAQQVPDPRVADLVQAGRIRVGLGVVAPHWAVKDRVSGELRGVAVDLARALAERLGVEFVPVEYPSPSRVPDGVKVGAWDVGFLGVDPSRATVVDFAPPHMQVEATYLVPANSSIRTIADADRPGVRIAVARKGVEEIVLSRMIKRAELRGVDTISAGFQLLRLGDVDVLAAPRPGLLQFSDQLSGSRVLEDRFHATYGAMAVPKGQVGRLAYISEFIEQAKASGLVRQAIDRAGVRGVQVAPAGNPRNQ
jgi:polar amino acid transport system substrate-binding protein